MQIPTPARASRVAPLRSLRPLVTLAAVACLSACGAPPRLPAVAPPSGQPPATYAPPLAPRPAAPALPVKVRELEGISEYRLGNGLSLLLFPDPSASTLTVNITYLVGSRLEGYGETGMAHLLEHMMFKGTPRHRNVLKLLQDKGAEVNGSTWTDRTNYYETLPASQDNLDWALDLESDRMLHASISPQDLSTEFSVVRNEFEIGENDPESILAERTLSTAYLWHNYGKATIGSRADIERVPAEALRAFYEEYYQPDNAVLVVAGKVDEAAALASVARWFGDIPRPSRVLRPSYTVEPVQDGERTVTLRRAGDVYALDVGYHTVGAASPDYPAVQAAMDVLTREPSGTLYGKLVETKLASRLSAYQLIFRDPYVANFRVRVASGKDMDRVEQILTSGIEGLGASKIDPKAVERWRNAELRDDELLFSDSARLAVRLSEYIGLGDWRTFFTYRQGVRKVTAEDVARVAREYFQPSNRTTGRFIPTKTPDRAPLTEAPAVAEIVKSVDAGPPIQQGEAFAATLENIEARTIRKTLAGGLSAALLPKKTRGGKVRLSLRLRWGDARSLLGKQTVAAFTAELLGRGTTHKSYQDIEDLKNVLRATIDIDGDADGLTLRIETLRDHLHDAIALATEMLRAPSLPAKELEIVRVAKLGALEKRLQSPQALGFNAAFQAVAPWPAADPRRSLSPAEQIALARKVTIADVQAFYRDFVGAGHGEVAVVGDFDPGAVSEQLETSFDGWAGKKPYARLEEKAFGVPAALKEIDTPDKENGVVVVVQDVPMRDDDPDYAAWRMVGKILAGDTASRLWMRVREKEGLSYAVGGTTLASSLDPRGLLVAYALVAPANMAKARASILQEVQRMATEGVTEEELARAKDAWEKELDTDLADDGHVLSMLGDEAYEGRTNAWTIGLRKAVAALTTRDIERVAASRIDPHRLVVVDAGDRKKASAPVPVK